MSHRIDCLQYANWSPEIFAQMREGGVDAVHVTIAYHETFRETVLNVERWNRWFEDHPDLIFQGLTGDDVRRAKTLADTNDAGKEFLSGQGNVDKLDRFAGADIAVLTGEVIPVFTEMLENTLAPAVAEVVGELDHLV